MNHILELFDEINRSAAHLILNKTDNSLNVFKFICFYFDL